MLRHTQMLLLVVVLSGSVGQSQTLRPRGSMPTRGGDPGPGMAVESLSARMAQLKADHEVLVKELTEIQALITAQRGDEAAQRCADLIAQRTAAFDDENKGLERQLATLKRMNARSKGKEHPSKIGQTAVLFQAKTLTGEEVNLIPDKGKIIVLEWINFGCPYSKYHYKTKKTMISLARRYQAQGVVWVAVNSTNTTSPEEYQRFLKTIGVDALPYPVVDDRDGKIGRAYGALITPQIVIVDTQGKIVYSGGVDNAPLGKTREPDGKEINYVDRVLSEMLKGAPVSIQETQTIGSVVNYAAKYASPEEAAIPGKSRIQ